jgi:antitoxin ParD1/3/4
MPSRNIHLTDHFERFIENTVAAGTFQNASEVVRAGLRLLEQQQRRDEAKLEALRAAAQVGLAALERGEYTELEPHEVSAHIRQLSERAAARVGATS